MRCNYHVHTYRCGHASGTEDEYIKKAIAEGIHTLGFSDHSPYPFEGGFLSYSRMRVSEMDGYFDSLLSLREKYRGYINILIGFETEYYPRYFDRLVELYRKYPLDYIIYAGHNIGNEDDPDCVSSFDKTDSPVLLRKYVDTAIAAMNTGRFSLVAHPDCINFVGDRDLYKSEMARLIREAKALRIPLELNLNGIRDRRHYPNRDFWQVAGWLGADCVLGFDAHQPEHVAVQSEILQGMRFLDGFGLYPMDEIELINPRF